MGSLSVKAIHVLRGKKKSEYALIQFCSPLLPNPLYFINYVRQLLVTYEIGIKVFQLPQWRNSGGSPKIKIYPMKASESSVFSTLVTETNVYFKNKLNKTQTYLNRS